jgi:hypothetical protein
MPVVGDTFVGGLALSAPLRSDSFPPAILAGPAERRQEIAVRLAQTGD